MRVVSIGDLVTDYYYKDDKLIGINGGMTSHNIIANLAKMGIKTSVFACCGDDCQGNIAINSLEKVKVDVTNIKIIENVRTRCFHVSYHDDKGKLSFTSKKRCPFCNNKKWYDESLLDTDFILSNIKNDDILVFDNLNSKNQIIIDNTNNKKIIDLGQYFEFEKITDDEIVKKLKSKFEIINFNERVTNYLLKRLNLKSDNELYNIIKPKLMTITRGENGATFITDNNVYNFELVTKGEVVDSTGAGAYFSARVINALYGCNTYSLYPRDVLYRNNSNIDKVILFSYSGTTNDIINSIKTFDNKNIYVVTKGELQNIVLKTGILKKNILSYRTASNKGKERGFLSFEGAVAPAALFLKYYLDKFNYEVDINDFIKNSIMYWNEQIEKIVDKNMVERLKNHNLINIFRGDYTNTACFDLESKIIESGIFNCIIHEKKNFSHGRFINYENLKNNFSIYFKQKSTTKYEIELLKYLDDNCILIESKYDGILAEFDLLIASQFIIYYIGKTLDIDVSKPKYSDNAMKIYFYKGNL